MAHYEFTPKSGEERLQRAKFLIHYDPTSVTDNTAIKECKRMVSEDGDFFPRVSGAIPSHTSYELTCLKDDCIKNVEWLFLKLDIPSKAEYERRKKEAEENKNKQVQQAS